MVTGRESDEAVGAVAQHATVPSQSETREAVDAVVQHATVPRAGESETRDEAVGAVVQHATVPSESEMRDEAMGAVAPRATVSESVRVRLSRDCVHNCGLRPPSVPEPVFGLVGAGDLAWLEG
jgi:hypothetical protein